MRINNVNELEFVVFCIESLAAKLEIPADILYEKLYDSGIINEYIVPEYEMLHTQAKDYIIDDILDVMRVKGVEV